MKLRVLICLLLACSLGFTGCEKKDAANEGGGDEAAAQKADEGAEGEQAEGEEAKAEGEEAKAEGEEAKAEGEEAKAEGEEAKADGDMGCEAVVTNTVNVMVEAQGDKSFFKKEDIPKLTEGCKKSKTMEEHAETAKCLQGIKEFKAMKECKDANAVVKGWAENAG